MFVYLLKDNTVLSTRQLQKYGPRSVRNEQVRNRKRISEALLHSKESASASHATCSKANTSGICSKENIFFSGLEHDLLANPWGN